MHGKRLRAMREDPAAFAYLPSVAEAAIRDAVAERDELRAEYGLVAEAARGFARAMEMGGGTELSRALDLYDARVETERREGR